MVPRRPQTWPVLPSISARYPTATASRYPELLGPDEVEALRARRTRLSHGELGGVDGLAQAGPGVADEDVLRNVLCIHFPHKLSQPMKNLLLHPQYAVLTKVIGPDVKPMQSMLFIKAEGKPGQAWHQDEFFIPTRDRSLTAAWIALDDATVDNGCLWVLPGSHRPGVIYPDRETTMRASTAPPSPTASPTPTRTPSRSR